MLLPRWGEGALRNRPMEEARHDGTLLILRRELMKLVTWHKLHRVDLCIKV